MSTIIKGSTKKGQQLIDRANNYEGYTLIDVYNDYSYSKQVAYNECMMKYLNTTNSHNFKICSYNTFQFSVSWDGIYEGERAVFIETACNSYIVLLDK